MLALPFDNNLAERNLPDTFCWTLSMRRSRSASGAAFSRIRGYLSSLSKQGIALLAALESVCTGRPLFSALT